MIHSKKRMPEATPKNDNTHSSYQVIERPDIDNVVKYFTLGQHAFVASDDEAQHRSIVRAARQALFNKPLECIAGDSIADLEKFGTSVIAACNGLVHAIGAPAITGRVSLSELLHETVLRFHKRDRQGFLVVNHVDRILALQHSYEIEGAFREIMQRFSDVAVLWIGSNSAILDIGQSDRPFYLSHRVFWV